MKKKILVIDDEEILTKTFTLLLQKSGYEVAVARNGETAIILAEEENYDLIISDIRMPGENGVETIKKIRGTTKTRDAVPVIFVTGYADPTVEVQAKRLNPIDYIHKPFDVAALLSKVKESIGV